MTITDAMVLPPDLVLAPVGDLPTEALANVEHGSGDWAVARPRSRTLTRIVDADLAALLGRFREERTIVDAVIDFAHAAGRDPRETLEEALPALQRFIDSRWLVPAGSPEAASIEQTHATGDRVAGCEVVEAVQVLEDTELYQARQADGRLVALKLARPGAGPLVARLFRREASVLRRLGGEPSPELLDADEAGSAPWLAMEWCAGVPVTVAAAEHRRGAGGQARQALRALALRVLDAYRSLHERGVVHGDVHPRNLLADADGRIRIVDFGLARVVDGDPELAAARRGGVAEYHEPELAAARLGRRRRPAATPAGVQCALAARLYHLFTGAAYLDFASEKTAMLRQVVEQGPLPFARRGAASWPDVERVLARALAKRPEDRYPSLAAMAADLAAAEPPREAPAPPPPAAPDVRAVPDGLVDRALLQLRPEGRLFAEGPAGTPAASLTFGAAGCAWTLLRLACLRDDPALLAQADLWAARAAALAGRDDAFYCPALDVTEATVGRVSPFHAVSGVHAVEALVAHARGDMVSMGGAIERFAAAADQPCENQDLTVGRSSVLVACALLFEAMAGVPPTTGFEDQRRDALRLLGDRTLAEVWAWAAAQPTIAEAREMRYTGIAHGWGGLCYAALLWCEAAGTPPPDGLPRRLDELAALAEPHGRGLRWPVRVQVPRRNGAPGYMASWCNGAPGLVHLWTAAGRRYRLEEHRRLAEGAAWNAWESHDVAGSICCGFAGRAYALLDRYRHTGDAVWVERARQLGARAAACTTDPAMPTSLYKGALGVALLAAELEAPETARLPFFALAGR